MGFYLVRWRYSQPAMKGMVDRPQDREAAGRKMVESFGGKMHSFFFAFGETDGLAITEFPDNESVAACVMALGASGGFTSMDTTVLITADEAARAMQLAHENKHDYNAPQE